MSTPWANCEQACRPIHGLGRLSRERGGSSLLGSGGVVWGSGGSDSGGYNNLGFVIFEYLVLWPSGWSVVLGRHSPRFESPRLQTFVLQKILIMIHEL